MRRQNIFRSRNQLIAKLNNRDGPRDNSFITKIIILKSVINALNDTNPLQHLNSTCSNWIYIRHDFIRNLKLNASEIII